MKNISFKSTFAACYTGIFVQAIVCGFMPLLFVIFNRTYGVALPQLTLLLTVSFLMQLATDSAAVFFVERLGYRRAGVIAHLLSAIGLFLLGIIVPSVKNTYLWMLISVVLFSVGCGLLEVILSPIVEGCPSENKSAALSFLHSMYGFGSAVVILVTTGLLAVFGSDCWRYISVMWAFVPLVNAVVFCIVPINKVLAENERISAKHLLSDKRFWGFMLIMTCGGASEIGISQWSSTFAEAALGISKAAGDILGPCTFAIMMALARVGYARFAYRLDLAKTIFWCGISGAFCYLVAALCPVDMVALIACGICGLAVGIMWPGSLSLASKAYPKGGAALFALLALGGDIGCTTGPSVVGFVASAFGGELRYGLLAGAIFPLIAVVGVKLISRKR